MDNHPSPRLIQPEIADSRYIQAAIHRLERRFPTLRRVALGHSLLGTPLEALVLPGEKAGGCRVLIAAAFHAQEWLTALCALRLGEELLLATESHALLCGLDIEKVRREREIWLLPLVNPDGVDIAIHGSAAAGDYAPFVARAGGDTPGLWQANARGVDLNHNFNAGWREPTGIEKPGPRRYRGEAPESEPETRAVTDLCRRSGFRHLIALHSQGEEIYWRYGPHTPPQSRLMATVLGEAGGYRVADPEAAAAHGGCKDWFIQCFHRPGFTLELGRGVNPLPIEDFETIYEKARYMLVLAATL